MKGVYTLFLRDENGLRGTMIPQFKKLVISLNWMKASKFTISGQSAGEVPLEDGNQIIIYRNGSKFLSGIIEKIEIECKTPDSDVRDWKATGRDLSLIFSWRTVLSDPKEITFEGETYDRIEDTAWNRLMHYIENCIGEGTLWERQLFPLFLPNREEIGETALSNYRNKKLDEVLEEIGNGQDLVPYLDRDDKTGEWQVSIFEARDMTNTVYFSPRFGNVLTWKRWSSIPECNAVWVVSGDYSKGRLYVYAEDTESIEHFGRIEKVVSRIDIAPWEPDEEEEEEEPVPEPEEEPEEGEEGEEQEEEPEEDTEEPEEEEEPKLSEEDVRVLLEQEAQTQLNDHGRKNTWTVEAMETQHMAFMDQWRIGDKVTCILDDDRFEAQITNIKITYEKGVEKVEPTIGDVEKGLFGEIFKLIRELDERITEVEN